MLVKSVWTALDGVVETKETVNGIVCISSVPWDHLKIAPQQTMKELSAWSPVLFVERATSIAGLLVDRAPTLGALRAWTKGPRQVLPNLTVVTPPLAAPYCTRSSAANTITMTRVRQL